MFGAISGAITYGIGDIGFLGQGFEAVVGKAGLHGVAQGALAEARGGEFGPAFLAASFAHAAGHYVQQIPGLADRSVQAIVGQTVAGAVIGGTASVIGGGKFQNGAMTGAFVTLFNQLSTSGQDPNTRHQRGVERAIEDYSGRGFDIVTATPVAVDVPGFETPRVYDFLVRDPFTARITGVEVKTTLGSVIRLDSMQVHKDAIVATAGGLARGLNLNVTSVGYRAYCFACQSLDLRSSALRGVLQGANIGVVEGRLPGDLR